MDENNVNRSRPEEWPDFNFDIPLQGSLGLLALGDLGIMAWRKARKAAANEEHMVENEFSEEDEI